MYDSVPMKYPINPSCNAKSLRMFKGLVQLLCECLFGGILRQQKTTKACKTSWEALKESQYDVEKDTACME